MSRKNLWSPARELPMYPARKRENSLAPNRISVTNQRAATTFSEIKAPVRVKNTMYT
jgi:hypothetical protein